MKIKSIFITGVKQKEREMSLEFSDLNVSVIYGENGCGKTTLLRLINAILGQQDSVLLNEKVEKVDIVYTNDINQEKKVHIEKKEHLIPSNKAEEGENELTYTRILGYDWSELKDSELTSMTSILFGVNRGIANNINISADYLYNYVIRTRYVDYFRSSEEVHTFCESICRNINIDQRRRKEE